MAVDSAWVHASVPLALAIFCWLLLESSARIHAVVGIEPVFMARGPHSNQGHFGNIVDDGSCPEKVVM